MNQRNFYNVRLSVLQSICKEYGDNFLILRDHEEILGLKDLHDVDTYLDERHSSSILHVIRKSLPDDFDCVQTICISSFMSFIIFSLADRNFFKLDIWTNFNWRGFKYFDIRPLKHYYFVTNGIYVLAPEYQYYLRVIKDLLYTKNIPLNKTGILNYNKKILNSNIVCEAINNYGYISDIFNISLDDPKFIRKYSTRLRRKIVLDSLWGIKLNFLFPFIKDKLKKYFFPNGKLVVLIGPDGSGKSTISNYLLNILGRNAFSGGDFYYSRPKIIPRLADLFKRNYFLDNDDFKRDDEPDNKNRIERKFISIIKVIYYTFDYFLARFIFYLKRANGRIIVFDRYFYDYYFQYFWSNCPFFIKRVCEFLIPSPDVVCVLRANPEKIFNRKPELSVSTIRSQYNKIDHLTSHLDKFDVRSDNDLSETELQLNLIIFYLYK